jgi:hypothetical protein
MHPTPIGLASLDGGHLNPRYVQVETTVPEQMNKLLAGVPTTIEVKGLELNTSLVRDPEVSPDRLIVWDWGRFKNPMGEKEVNFISSPPLPSPPREYQAKEEGAPSDRHRKRWLCNIQDAASGF